LNKEELVKAMAQQSGLSQKVSEATLNAFLHVVQETVKSNQKVALVGFGTFALRERAARTCINPRTKEAMTVPAKKAAAFKAGKGFQLEQVPAAVTGKKPSGQKRSGSSSSPALLKRSEESLTLVTEAKARELLMLDDGRLATQRSPARAVEL
jgi:DNA-binding protein HU-beta